MKKNDKLIVLFGVLILVMASIGVYYWAPQETKKVEANLEEVFSVSGVLSSNAPDAISVLDCSPFYALIATPLAVHYDTEGVQHTKPFLVVNLDDPSSAVTKLYDQLDMQSGKIQIPAKEGTSAKECSLQIAKEYWDHSDGVLIIENNETGYDLGVVAAPLASYLTMPIIVTDELDQDVNKVLQDLGVKYSLVCGDVDGYGDYIKFDDVDEIVDASIELVQEKFGDIDYITLANPRDAWPPKVLDAVSFSFGPMTIPSGSSTRIGQALLKGGAYTLGTFKIPNDYKYALIKFEGINLDCENVDELGDSVTFTVGANLPDIPSPLQTNEGFSGSTATGGIAERDANGNLITDMIYGETVLYGRGGVEYTVRCKGQWLTLKQGRVTANVVVEKLENPVYPMMKGLSSLAPYLTAYHHGIVFAKPEFAFTADDDVLTDEGTTSPGFYMPRRNPRITDKANTHFFDVIHKPLNDVLAKIADIELVDDRDIKTLRDHYDAFPVYIALVGDGTVLPNFIYQNYLEPVDYWNGQYGWGVGTPSDVVYGNIDPTLYDWSNLANDVFTKYPYQENIVGRITGWDAQDASALIARNIFYSDIIEKLGDWKDTFTVLVGEGQDFQQPPIKYPIAKLLGAGHAGEPMKLETGYGEIMLEKMVVDAKETWGFTTVYQAYKEQAGLQGFSDEALNKIKYESAAYNKLLFFKPMIRKLVGEGAVTGGKMIEDANFAFLNGHGNMAILAMDGIDLISSGIGGPIAKFMMKKVLEVVSPSTGPGSSLAAHCQYNTRQVETMKLGPSFVWLESCICGKIDGMYPKGSLGQSFLHAGVATLIASPTGSNIAGGYLEPKKRQVDTHLSVLASYIKAKRNAKNGIYPDDHFGFLIYSDMLDSITNDDATFGKALRDAKNKYIPQDADWELWWSPPLVNTGDLAEDVQIRNTYSNLMESAALEDPYMMKNKYTSYQEYMLFGDPALNPYDPLNEGGK